jgi:hypothetical protein
MQATGMNKKSTQGLQLLTTRQITRSQRKTSVEVLVASVLASTTINGDPSTYADATASPLEITAMEPLTRRMLPSS